MTLDYVDRCERYARQRGWTYDPKRMSIDHLTPRQRRRALKKERHQYPHPRHVVYVDYDVFLPETPVDPL